jgi:hypothetical protein
MEVELGRAILGNRTRRATTNYGGYAARGTNPSYDGSDSGGGQNTQSDQEGGYGNDVNIIPTDSTGSPIETECPGCCMPGRKY